jgi:ComF family protein
VTNPLLNSLFPKTCPACQQSSESLFCDDCEVKINFLEGKGCQRCAEDHGPFLKPETCPSCQHSSWSLNKVIALASYEAPIREALISLKFGGRGSGANFLATKLASRINPDDFDYIVPVPSPLLRRLKRGYNQAELLARDISRQSQTPLLNALKCRWKKTQIGKRADQRRHLSADFFKINKKVAGKKIALVDDILTTGGTANACASTLLEAGASEVSLLVVARRFQMHK